MTKRAYLMMKATQAGIVDPVTAAYRIQDWLMSHPNPDEDLREEKTLEEWERWFNLTG